MTKIGAIDCAVHLRHKSKQNIQRHSQPFDLSEAKALRLQARLNLPGAFSSYFITKKIKWLILLLM